MTRRGFILFAALGVIWGVPYLFIKIAVVELSPEFLVLARCAIAAALLLPIAARRGAIAPVLRRWKPLLAFTIVELVVPWYALNVAEQSLPSSTTGLLLASIPIVAIGVVFALGGRDRIRALNALGILIGMAGVAVVVGLDLSGNDLGSVALVGVAVVGYAIGPVILSRWMHDLPGIGVMAAALALAGLIYLPVVAITGGWPTEVPSPAVITSVLVLAVLCSAIAFLLMFALIAEIGPIRTSAITYVNPAVAVVAGALVLGEAVTAFTLLGFGLILVGCWFVTLPERRGAAPPAEEEIAAQPAPVV
jgi:drug/metabolite transporter (DMT)-like permease